MLDTSGSSPGSWNSSQSRVSCPGPEPRKVWFKNRRAKSRRNERAAVVQAPAPAAMRRLYLILLDGS
ncbi:hypothetical protein MJG53_020095 [Ovis ammon polii x Ovis aries]|uniref:Homeobox domain-containing protein n=3 Tax=Ovis TaxID=9935 RepID=A0A836CPH8_SHEEP|nr:hypothetical protein JEQ12_020443 [Ovis aries]KAI4545005.1 hypothetical protein MG293_005271 [Ovis ammon polii]KAI4554796.1 hypothetical protein MJG53_020095 [Ovis ammon polii x Ovis aries]